MLVWFMITPSNHETLYAFHFVVLLQSLVIYSLFYKYFTISFFFVSRYCFVILVIFTSGSSLLRETPVHSRVQTCDMMVDAYD